MNHSFSFLTFRYFSAFSSYFQAQLEKLQKQIQSIAKKTGISSAAKLALVTPKREAEDETPDAEWWDRGILPNQTYDDLDKQMEDNESTLKGITNLIEHPVQKEPPGRKTFGLCSVASCFLHGISNQVSSCNLVNQSSHMS